MSTSRPTLAREIGRSITIVVLAITLLAAILVALYVVNALGSGCACQPSPPPTSTPIATLRMSLA
jgi:hypothetical protein